MDKGKRLAVCMLVGVAAGQVMPAIADFEQTGSPDDFEAWHAILDPADRASAVAEARERARSSDDPITGAQLLLALRMTKPPKRCLSPDTRASAGSSITGSCRSPRRWRGMGGFSERSFAIARSSPPYSRGHTREHTATRQSILACCAALTRR